jgi:hypothetical protein
MFRRVPYISASEYRFAPTAVATNGLVAGSTNQAADSLNSLAQVIRRASAWIDDYCFHRSDGTLAASVTTESAWLKANSGTLAMICNYKPILEVTGLALGYSPSQLSNVTSNVSDTLWWDSKVIYASNWQASMVYGDVPLFPNSRFGTTFAVWTYVNGFPLATLGANATAGQSSIVLNPAVTASTIYGVYAGTQLEIRDANTEVVVASAAPNGLTLELSSPLQYSHTMPLPPDYTKVTALPSAIEQACISLTSCLIKTTGTRAMTMSQTPGAAPDKTALAQAGALEDFEIAADLLSPYMTVVLH